MWISSFQFARPWALLLLALLPFVWLWVARGRKSRPVLRLPSAALYANTRPTLASLLRGLPALFKALALLLVVGALARPQVRSSKNEDVSVEGIDVVLVLDVSTSMKAADFKPVNRLAVAKRVMADFIEKRVNDRIGLVVFAGEAFTQAPLTLDYPVLLDVLDAVRMGVIQDGTAIGNALATAVNRLRSSEAKSKVIILVTDGDSNAGNISPTQAAAIAAELGIRVYPIMVGKGGEVPYPAGRDAWGRVAYQNVRIPVNPELLKEIAAATGGSYYRATDKKSLEENFQAILDDLEKSKLMEGGVYVNYTEVFPLLALPAVLLLFFSYLLAATRLRTFP
ncbi:MAG: VWA domain-containing protein [Deltaproteobacteria bacterium]|nr:VWA domain-containing protein [Deltaproteobacteria bacterium]